MVKHAVAVWMRIGLGCCTALLALFSACSGTSRDPLGIDQKAPDTGAQSQIDAAAETEVDPALMA